VSGSITISLSSSKVTVGGTVSVVGHLATSSGAPVPNQRIWLLERLTGQNTVSQVAMGLTGSDGSVALTSPALTQSARLRLVAGGQARSAALPVVVLPTLTATATANGSTYSITVTTDGGNPGDEVLLQIRTGNGWQPVSSTTLDGSGDAGFGVLTPAHRAAHYRVALARTPAHGYAETRVVVPPA
jgi:hypothetical protein